MKKTNTFINITLFFLVTTTFPLAQGWLPLKDLPMRLLFLIIAFFLFFNIFKTKQIKYLLFYFIYAFIGFALNGHLNIISLLTKICNIAFPVVIICSLILMKNEVQYKKIAYCGLSILFVTLSLTMYSIQKNPGIVREMVYITRDSDFDAIMKARRMGISNYALASIIMFMPTVLFYIYKKLKGVYKFLCIIGIILSFLFMYSSGISTPLLFAVVTFTISLFINENTNIKKLFVFSLITLIIIILTYNPLFELLKPIIGDTDLGYRMSDISVLISEGNTEDTEDLGGRINLYKKSLDAFLISPLFGVFDESLIGHHAYFVDILALYGIIGFSLFVKFLFSIFKKIFNNLPQSSRAYYVIITASYIAFGFVKNISGVDFWLFILVYYPCMFFIVNNTKRISI